jgi:hypothetical protein
MPAPPVSLKCVDRAAADLGGYRNDFRPYLAKKIFNNLAYTGDRRVADPGDPKHG